MYEERLELCWTDWGFLLKGIGHTDDCAYGVP